jgi:hypothetical protein
MFFMGTSNRYFCRAVLISAILLTATHGAPLGAAVTGPVLIEGFEDGSIAVVNSAVKIVSEGPGITQDKSAARLDPKGAITISVRLVDIAKLPWLRLDTLHGAVGTRGLDLSISSGTLTTSVSGYVASGKDTLAYPLSMVFPKPAKAGDLRTAKITITNISDTPIVVDNIRLEPLVRTPRGSVLWDFGGAKNLAWPGFVAHGVSGNGVKWKADPSYYYGYQLPYADPLTQDFIGPYSSSLGNGKKVPVAITAPEPKTMYAWLWLTHYGKSYTQPQEYLCRATAGGRPVGRKLTARQLVGPDGLLEGAGGDWTPQWFATKYADHFVTVMPFAMPRGKGVLELVNCQMAALAMVPASGRSTMTSCIKQIQGELVRYRRQFVMKHLDRNICSLEPTEAEKKAGIMLFRPPGDEAFTGQWKPRADQRVWALHELARPGGTVRIPLAFVPLTKRAISFSIIPGSLRSESNTTLPLNRSNVRIDYMHTVPEVREGITIRRPWLLNARSEPVAIKEIGHAWLTVSIPKLARKGVYRGLWKLGSGAARVSLPVEVEIVNSDRTPAPDAEEFAVISYSLPSAVVPYRGALSALSKPKQLKLQGDVFRQVTAAGVNGYEFPGVGVTYGGSSGSYVTTSTIIQSTLDGFPLKQLSGPTFININQAMASSGWGASEKNRAVLIKAIAESNDLSLKYSIENRYFYLGLAKRLKDTESTAGLETLLAGAGRIASDNCRTAVHGWSSELQKLTAADFDAKLAPVSALILTPNTSSTATQLDRFRKLNGIRKTFLYCPYPDRFTMGFYSTSLRADGCVISTVFMSGQTYNGFARQGNGLVATQLGGKLAHTASAARLKQAQNDRALVHQARALVSAAVKASVSPAEISDLLAEIDARARSVKAIVYDPTQFATTAVSQAEMDSWRASLLNAMGVVNRRIPKKPKR